MKPCLRFILCCMVLMAAGALAQDSQKLRAPLNGWLSEAPKVQTLADGETLAAEGRVRQLTTVAEDSIWFFTTGGADRNLLLRIDSPGAAAIRVHFEEFRLPENAVAYVYGLDGNGRVTRVAGPYIGAGPLGNGDFWSRSVPGSSAVVEVQLEDEIANLPYVVREAAVLDAIEDWAEVTATKSTETRTSIYRGMAVTHEVVDGLAIAGGDMILGPADQLEPYTEGKILPSRESVAISLLQVRWPGGNIPYVIDPALPNPQRVLDAVAHWNTNLAGHINLKPRTNETAYVTFRSAPDTVCSSYVGGWGGNQPINIGAYCSVGNVIHEIGHTVGFWHEHTRSDRNNYVQVLTQNIDPAYAGNFNIQSYSMNTTGYDYNSVMHYPAYAFSINGQPTIVTIPAGIPIGQRNGLSVSDIAGAKAIYPATTPPPPPPPGPTTVNITLASNPTGMTLTADGSSVTAPAVKSWTPGSAHIIGAPNPAPVNGVRKTFVNWSDGGQQTHGITTPNAATVITAYYATQYQAAVSANPPNIGAIVGRSPASADGYYAGGTNLTLAATAPLSYCFTGWSGILPVNSTVANVAVTGALNITANFKPGQVQGPSVIQVAAGATTLGVSVLATSGCIWKAASLTPWVTIPNPSGLSSGTLTLTLQPNTSPVSRFGVIQLNNQYVFILQAGK
ncbi:MAG: hypothetical protein HYZ37_01895 [Candidatus Solibacter usitatus]|nr:hypothetical protein [Candidatus Solibacter usitatus]